MPAPECERSDDAAAYALGALDESEAKDFAAHLERCARCPASVEWLRPAIETLPESVEQLTPPPGLRDRLLAEVRADAAPAPAPQGWRAKRLRLGGLSFGPATALAALLIAVAAVIGYGVGGPGGGDGTRTVPVASREPGSSADLELTENSATLQAQNVPQLPPGAVYQVWVVSGGGPPRASSMFRPSRDGSAAAAVPEALSDADTVLVTREPSRGSPEPSSRPIYAAQIPR